MEAPARRELRVAVPSSDLRWRVSNMSRGLSGMDASYHDVYVRSLRDPEGFWSEAAQEID